VFADIEAVARAWPRAHRVFLAGGDAVTLSVESPGAILDKLRQTFSALARVSAYATSKNLLEKSSDDLAELRMRGVNLINLGIESGATAVLKRIRKGATQESMPRALERAHGAGLKVSAAIILGLGGGAGWEEHISGKAVLINRQP
jgi:radical SAM superfamily enzyme YgiQ (UPF0313 family)